MARTEHPRFASWDGTRIACSVRGDLAGDRTCVFVNGLFGTDAYWVFLERDLAADHRLVTFDLRGHGGSDPPLEAAHVGVSDVARDVRALLDHVDIERAVLLGFSYGVQVALEAWRLFPERISGFVLIAGPAGDPLSAVYDLGIPPRVWRATAGNLARYLPRSTQAAWHAAFHLPIWHPLATLAHLTRAEPAHLKPFLDHQTRLHVPTALRMAMAAGEHSARDLLPSIRVPTLVVAGGRDTVTPLSHLEILRDGIPEAGWLLVPEGTHTLLVEDPERIGARVRAFLASVHEPLGGA